MRRKNDSSYWPWETVTNSTKLSGKGCNLKSYTTYLFRVRAVNKNDKSSEFSEVLEVKTKHSKHAKRALAPLVFLGGTLAGPAIVGGLGAGGGALVGASPGILLGIGISSIKEESKVTDGVGVAAGLAVGAPVAVVGGVLGGAGGAVVGTVGAPVVGGVLTRKFLKDSEWSDQSSDEDD